MCGLWRTRARARAPDIDTWRTRARARAPDIDTWRTRARAPDIDTTAAVFGNFIATLRDADCGILETTRHEKADG